MEPTPITAQTSDQASFMAQVYRWMAGGLFVTALVSFLVLSSQTLLTLFLGNTLVFYGILIAEIGIVFYLSSKVQSLSTETASILFFLYAALNGVTLSLIFLVYTASSIATVFLTAAGTFGLMSLYGSSTQKDLTSMGNLAFMGLLGLIVASVINIFTGSRTADWYISAFGVLVFVGLTAYDTQKIKNMRVPAVIGALNLYLDFINLFLHLLRLGGKRR